MSTFKSVFFIGLLSVSGIIHAEIFPGSTITLNDNLSVTRAIAHRDWSSSEAMFSGGTRIKPTEFAASAGVDVCQVITGADNQINKGTYTYDGAGNFIKFSADDNTHEFFRINCTESWDNSAAHTFPLNKQLERTPELLMKTIGNNLSFRFATAEQFNASGIILSTGTKYGKESDMGGYAGPACGYSIFRAGNDFKILLSGQATGRCVMKIERSSLSRNVLTLSGKQSDGSKDCSLRLHLAGANTTSLVEMINDYNNGISTCYLK
jgi:hypothetical protein